MAIDWQAEGLLAGVDGDESARRSRIDLLQELHENGVTLDELREAVAEERLALLPVERVLAGEGETHTAAETAELAGLEPDELRRMTLALGLPWPAPEERSFTDLDIEGLAANRVFQDAGLPEEARLGIARVIGMGMSTLASAIRTMIVEIFGPQGGESEHELGLRYAEAGRQLAPALAPVLQNVLRAHLREQIRQDVVERATAGGGVAGTRRVAACFADLVGFTRLGEELPPDELSQIALRLVDLAAEHVEPPVRLVKTIGDAVMLVSPEPRPLVDAALALVDAAEGLGERLPQLRAGLAVGEAVAYGGDWYGRPVNLASRLTGIARPGSVLTTEEVREALGDDGYNWSFAGQRHVRGIRGELRLVRVRATSGSTGKGR